MRLATACNSRSPMSCPERVVDRLEAIQVDEQDRHFLAIALRPRQHLRDAVVEQRPIRQLRQRIVVGQVLDALARLRPLDGDRRRVGRHLHHAPVVRGRRARLAVVHREGAHHPLLGVEDRRRPAGAPARAPSRVPGSRPTADRSGCRRRSPSASCTPRSRTSPPPARWPSRRWPCSSVSGRRDGSGRAQVNAVGYPAGRCRTGSGCPAARSSRSAP